MLAERPTRTPEELRQEFSKMQRAQFILWLVEQDQEAVRELDEAANLTDDQYQDWQKVKEELNKRFGG
jgi:ribosomal protein S6